MHASAPAVNLPASTLSASSSSASSRRHFLGASAALTTGALIAGCTPTPTYPSQSELPFEGTGPFPSGVGSADPLPEAVLLWTRIHPTLRDGQPVRVEVEVATQPTFLESSIVSRIDTVADQSSDFCVTVDATGLRPRTRYWYRFHAEGATSPIGRTQTAPREDSRVEKVRIAAFSCQRWTHGWYTAHADLAAMADQDDTDIDVVICLGDYIYETGYADKVHVPGRDDPVQQAVTLEQFRSKYRMYRSDPNLQAVHARYPMIHVFDNHDGLSGPGDIQAAGAIQAFFEHIPVRTTQPGQIYRSLRWGQCVDIVMTDQRQYRDPQPVGSALGASTEDNPEILDPHRSMLGLEQRDWLLQQLTQSTATWKVFGSQLMFWPWRIVPRLPWQPRGSGWYLNMTQWDGYVGERLIILDALDAANVSNTVILSGDSHVFSAAQVSSDVDDPYRDPRIVEFGTGSITSNNADESDYMPESAYTAPFLYAMNPNHLKYFESESHGYVIAELHESEMFTTIRSPYSIRHPESLSRTLATWRVGAGTQRLERIE